MQNSKKTYLIFFLFLVLNFSLQINGNEKKADFETKSIRSTLDISGKQLAYICTSGFLPIKADDGKEYASLFYFAYHKETEKNSSPRPITFCFSGGPGLSSVLMHFGGIGPLRIQLQQPHSYENNPYSILEFTDLVFIDPISTGFSHAEPESLAKNFYNVKEDTKVLAEFVRQYLTRNNLWNSPKYLMGESYGGFRIAHIASYLYNYYFTYLNGLIFLSPVINYQTIIDPDSSNDLPYPLYLPSYAATTEFHKKSDRETIEKTVKSAEDFALNAYASALFKGDAITPIEKKQIAADLSSFTGLPEDTFLRSHLRLTPRTYEFELFKNTQEMLGTFDSRFIRPAVRENKPFFGHVDPSIDAYMGTFTQAINTYLFQELGIKEPRPYQIVASVNPWDFGENNNQFASVSDKIRNLLTLDQNLRIFVASGYYDLSTPYYSINYSFNHLSLDPSLTKHWEEHRYYAGHLIYLDPKTLILLKDDLKSFYK